jgi:hypothetical protein
MQHYLQVAAPLAFYHRRVRELSALARSGGRPRTPVFPRVEPVVVYVSMRSEEDRAAPSAAGKGGRAPLGRAHGTHRTQTTGVGGDGTILQWRGAPWQWTAATDEERDALLGCI